MLGTWEGGWGSGPSCWTAGIVDLHNGSSCWTLGMEAGIVDLHVGHLGWKLG